MEKSIVKRIVKWMLIVVAGAIALLIGLFLLLNSETMQSKLVAEATRLLSEKLETRVKIDRARVNVLRQYVELDGVAIDDRQGRTMFEMEQLKVDFRWAALLHNEVRITYASVSGMQARLFKERPDTAANFQFVIDAFKTPGGQKPATKEQQPEEQKPKGSTQLDLDLRKLLLNRIGVQFNNDHYTLHQLSYERVWGGRHKGTLRNLQAQWTRTNKKGEDVTNNARIGLLKYQEKKQQHFITVDSLQYTTDNHRPRRNANKPKRGFFDVGHLDITAHLSLAVTHADKDSICGHISELQAKDATTGIDITNLNCRIKATRQNISLSDVKICQKQTYLQFAKGVVNLPPKDTIRKDSVKHFTYSTSLITGRAWLRDISRPFAPVLSHFNEPLDLQLYLKGNEDAMQFSQVVITTTDKKLKVKANGHISHLKDKYRLRVHFNINDMEARRGVPIRIINQFVVKKFMLQQLDSLGNIHYNGQFDVLWKKELFGGTLHTDAGKVRFNFGIDENTKYLSGSVSTGDIQLNRLLNMPDLGVTACKANFRFDISKPRTARMRRLKGGKLPIGHIDAHVDQAKYKFIKVNNISVEINSDGAIAEGELISKGRRTDLLCSFSFTNTNALNKMKIKPGIRFHSLSDEDRLTKEERKRQKAEEKSLRKQQKAEEKARKKEQEAAEKQQKAEEKARKKEQKAKEREEKRAAKQAAKEARRAAKEQQEI